MTGGATTHLRVRDAQNRPFGISKPGECPRNRQLKDFPRPQVPKREAEGAFLPDGFDQG
jgi:hypothetical protein